MNNGVNQELFQRHADNPILSVDDWSYPVNSVFNPAVTVFKDQILLLIRAEDFRGHLHFTVARTDDGVRDWQFDGAPTMCFFPYPAELHQSSSSPKMPPLVLPRFFGQTWVLFIIKHF